MVAADGTVLAAYGREPDGDTTSYSSPIVVDGVPVATLEATLPSRGTDRAFLPLFNVTLIVAGFVSVLGIVLVSTSIAARLTRPLRDVASAARRLEAGDAGARATGGDDLESSELAEAFNAMADRLERSEMLRRRAASDIAHDLATPATVLESQLQAMIDGVVPTDLAGLEAARSAAAALGGVVADIDDLARAEAAPLQARPAEVDLAVGHRRRSRRRSTASGATVGATLDVEVPSGLDRLGRSRRPVAGAPQRRRERAGPQPVRRRRVGRAADGGHGSSDRRSASRDQGPGIAADDLPHVFERFYRADTARATDPATGRPTGLGLGLTIARELLAASGGRHRRGTDRPRRHHLPRRGGAGSAEDHPPDVGLVRGEPDRDERRREGRGLQGAQGRGAHARPRGIEDAAAPVVQRDRDPQRRDGLRVGVLDRPGRRRTGRCRSGRSSWWSGSVRRSGESSGSH